MKNISATSYTTYHTCPFKWHLNYNERLLQMPNTAFYLGTMYHRGVELISKGVGLEAAIQHVKDVIFSDKGDKKERLEFFGLVQTMMKKYSEYPVTGKTIDTEYKFSVNIPGIEPPLIGFIDRIIEGGIVEYKTTSQDFEHKDIATPQADIYSYVYNHRFGQMPLVIYSVMNKKKVKQPSYQPQRMEIKRTKQDMENLELGIASLVDNVNSKKFKAKPGEYCFWCPFGRHGTNNCKYSR